VFHSFHYGPSFGELANANSKANSAENKARTAEFDVRRLVERIDSLALTCQAMWELLRKKTDLTDDELRQKMQEVDLRDGTADGRLKSVAVDCTECGRPVNSRRKACQYCGCEMQADQVFDK
jgi:hypothetical protein